MSFDESLNKIAQKSQMDLVVRLWKDDLLVTKYLNSIFLLDATAKALLDGLTSDLKKLGIQLNKIIQLSMDGPNVNLKLLKDLKQHLLHTFGIDSPELIDIGTCSLHIVNNSFKTGHKESGWKIDDFLREIYYLFVSHSFTEKEK